MIKIHSDSENNDNNDNHENNDNLIAGKQAMATVFTLSSE
jgi:hypothetical protein